MKLNFEKFKIPKTELRSFILTLIATLVGVFIAISLTNSEIEQKEKKDTVKLLNTSCFILENTKSYSQELSRVVQILKKDTINRSREYILETELSNPIPFPHLLETVVANEIVSKNISEFSHSQIYTGLINLRKLANYQTIAMYEKSLSELITLINLEIEFQKGIIEIEDIKNQLKIARKELEKKYPDKNVIEVKKE